MANIMYEHKHPLTDPAEWDGEDYDIEWHEQHKPHWWSGTATMWYGREQVEVSVFGDPAGDAFRQIETITDIETVDVLADVDMEDHYKQREGP